MDSQLDVIKFQLGHVAMTSAVAFSLNIGEIVNCLTRHQTGDWGTVCKRDKQANERALRDGDRILSKYGTTEGDIYIITEHDRSYTTVMFINEY